MFHSESEGRKNPSLRGERSRLWSPGLYQTGQGPPHWGEQAALLSPQGKCSSHLQSPTETRPE